MTTALQTVDVLSAAPLRLVTGHRHTAETILDAWRAGKSPHTIAIV